MCIDADEPEVFDESAAGTGDLLELGADAVPVRVGPKVEFYDELVCHQAPQTFYIRFRAAAQPCSSRP